MITSSLFPVPSRVDFEQLRVAGATDPTPCFDTMGQQYARQTTCSQLGERLFSLIHDNPNHIAGADSVIDNFEKGTGRAFIGAVLIEGEVRQFTERDRLQWNSNNLLSSSPRHWGQPAPTAGLQIVTSAYRYASGVSLTFQVPQLARVELTHHTDRGVAAKAAGWRVWGVAPAANGNPAYRKGSPRVKPVDIEVATQTIAAFFGS